MKHLDGQEILFITNPVIAAMLLSACIYSRQYTPVSATAIPIEPGVTPSSIIPTATPSPEPIVIRWLYTGVWVEEAREPAETELVKGFKWRVYPRLDMQVEHIPGHPRDWETVYNATDSAIVSNQPPDIVGPLAVHIAGKWSDMWLDLDPLIKEAGFDLGDFNPALLDFYRSAKNGLEGFPIGVYPTFILYNRDLFDKAGLPYPPHKYGEPYADGAPWTTAKLEEIALKLTLDDQGRNASDPAFAPEYIVQFGYAPPLADPRGAAVLFGAGSFVNAEGNAVIPEHWRTALKWYYSGMWEKHFIPTKPDMSPDRFGTERFGLTYSPDIERIAMWQCHL